MKTYSPLHNSAPYHRLARAKLVVPLVESGIAAIFIAFSYFDLNRLTVLSFNDGNLDFYRETAFDVPFSTAYLQISKRSLGV